MHGIAPLLILFSALGQASSESAGKAEELPKAPAPVITRQMEFQLPFEIPKSEANRTPPVEVRLFVSPDHGRSWKTHSRVSPSKGFCAFKAKQDGQYWFMIRTADRRGNLWPQDAAKPEMKVVIDTKPPEVDLKATWVPAGPLSATWNVADQTLAVDSLKLQYRDAATEAWQNVAITPAAMDHPHTQSGKATWWPRATTGEITVRFEARDKAGNPAVVQRTLKSQRGNPRDKIAQHQVARPPVANNFAQRTPPQTPAEQPRQPQANRRTAPANNRAAPAARTPAPAARSTRPMPTCRVKLTSTARQHDRLTIRWQTSGTSILRKTIHLAYSTSAEGPWLPVALNQQDDGHHTWNLPHNVPEQVFVMIEVADRAGASSRYVTPSPLRLRAKSSTVPQTGHLPAEYRFF